MLEYFHDNVGQYCIKKYKVSMFVFGMFYFWNFVMSC